MSTRILSVFLLLLLACGASFGQAKGRRPVQNKPRTPGTAEVEAELKKLEREWFDAVVKNDRATLDRIFADDFLALSPDGSFIPKKEMADLLTSGRLKIDEIRLDEFKLQLYGNTAVVTGRATYVINQRPLGQDGHVEIWVRRAGPSGKEQWQAVSWTSIPFSRGMNAQAENPAKTEEREEAKKEEMTTEPSLKIEDLVVGVGISPRPGQDVTVHYTGTLEDGTKFDSSRDHGGPFTFKIGVGQVIKGWDQGVMTMKVGGKRKLIVPPQLGYGSRRAGSIPPNSTLIFEVELLEVK